MKKLTLLFCLLALNYSSFAQKNFYKLSVGAGAGFAITFADLDKKPLSFAGYGTVDYHFTPYLSLGVELQKGELAGGDIIFDPNHQQFVNSYISGTVNFNLSIGEFIADRQRNIPIYNFLSGLYAGFGLGLIKNDLSNVRYYGDDYFPGESKSTEEIMPINLGYKINFPDKWGYDRYGLKINFQTTIDFGEGLDGYTTPVVKYDYYSFFSVGLKYYLGFMGLDKRR